MPLLRPRNATLVAVPRLSRLTRRAMIGVVVASLSLARCASDTPTPAQPSDATEDVALTAAASIDLVGGGAARGSVDYVRSGPLRGALSLIVEGLPPGVRITFDGGIDPSVRSARVFYTLTAEPTVDAGRYEVLVKATLNGDVRSATRATVAVRRAAAPPNPQTPFITLSTSTSSVNTLIGTSISIPVLAARSGIWEDDVLLFISGLPAGVTATFSPERLSGWLNQSRSQLDIVTSPNASPGTYMMTIHAQYETMGLPTEIRVPLVLK